MNVILEDEPYYRVSGGGVTLSGGEPLLHLDFIAALISRLHDRKISVYVETSGHFIYPEFERTVLPFLNGVLFDLKIADPTQHRRCTGVDNELILANFDKLVRVPYIRVIPRTPLIPGITDTDQNLAEIKTFLAGYDLTDQHVLLPYNDGGIEKRRRLCSDRRTVSPQSADPLKASVCI